MGDNNENIKISNEVPPPSGTATAAIPAIKHDFYQTDSDVVVSFLIKNLKTEDVKVDFTEKELKVGIKLSDGTDYNEILNLAHSIKPGYSSFKVLGSKIEMRLRKDNACVWSTLETVITRDIENTIQPSYPSSSKTKKDWSKMEKELEKDNPDDDDVNNLFAKIFASGDENTKRAMMKSMQESGGTVLSTNWDEVGKKRVEVSPPDGMEWKKWDESNANKK